MAISFLRGNGKLFRGTEIEHNIEAAYGKLDAFVSIVQGTGPAKKHDMCVLHSEPKKAEIH